MKKRHMLGLLILAELFGAACSRCASDKNKSSQENLDQIVESLFAETSQQEEQLDIYTVKNQMLHPLDYDLPPEMMRRDNRVLLHEPVEKIDVNFGFSPVQTVPFER